MVSPVLGENYYTGGFLISELPNTLSRDVATWDNTAGVANLLVEAGTVYSLEALGTPTAAPNAGNHGNATFGAITVNLLAPVVPPPGAVYQVVFTGATTFNVIDDKGAELSPGSTGVAYTDRLQFTITAGGTAMQAGDGFAITIPAGTGYATAYTGAAAAAGIAYNLAWVPAGSTAPITAVLRNAEVTASSLQWAPGVTAPQQAAALATLRLAGIIAR